MKKVSAFTLALLLVFSLFVSCGKNGGGNGADDSAKQKEIKPSELITLEDAERILGRDMQAVDVDKTDSQYIFTLYEKVSGDIEYVRIDLHYGGSPFAEIIKDENDIVKDVGDWACIIVGGFGSVGHSVGMRLCIDYSGYQIVIRLTCDQFNDLRSAEENAARTTEKLKEFGKLAVERIDAIIN